MEGPKHGITAAITAQVSFPNPWPPERTTNTLEARRKRSPGLRRLGVRGGFRGRPASLRLQFMSAGLSIPISLARAAEEEGREDWLQTLPSTLRELESRW
jgi:hypothetical protein